MTSLREPASGLQRLPPDQRAVLEMVLSRGQSYDEIARRLRIDRAAVRQRALSALDLLGPAARISPDRRALITDYLLGQLPERVGDEVHDDLTRSASERAWARVVVSELASLSPTPLPAIPAGEFEAGAASESEAGSVADTGPAAARDHDATARDAEVPGAAQPARPVSRLGGAILLGAVGAAIAGILIFVVFGVGGSTAHKKPAAKNPGSTASTNASAKPVAQINLVSPSHSKTVGIAEVIKVGSATGVVVVAQGLKANANGNAYAIWLYNSPSSAYRLGYVKPGVTSNGRLQTAGRLPANASSYKQIVLALQHGPSNKPGTVVLRGNLSGV